MRERGSTMNREELLEREDEAWLDIKAAFLGLPPDRREVEGVVPGWSTHDLVWHCVYWAADVAEVLERLRRGDPEPEEGDTGSRDAEILAEGRGMTWDEIVLRAGLSRERVRAVLSAFGEDVPEAAVELFADETFEHYEEHAAQIRAFSEGHDRD
jgi:hypothetical protein